MRQSVRHPGEDDGDDRVPAGALAPAVESAPPSSASLRFHLIVLGLESWCCAALGHDRREYDVHGLRYTACRRCGSLARDGVTAMRRSRARIALVAVAVALATLALVWGLVALTPGDRVAPDGLGDRVAIPRVVEDAPAPELAPRP